MFEAAIALRYHFFSFASMKKILYITRANLCLRRAHSHNIMTTARVLARCNEISVALVSSGKQSCTVTETFLRHGIYEDCAITKTRSLVFFLFRKGREFDIVYFRDPRLVGVIFLARLLGKKIIFEIHGSREWKGLWWLWRLAFRLSHIRLFITRALQADYPRASKNIFCIPTVALNLSDYDIQPAGHKGFRALSLVGEQNRYYDVMMLVRMLSYCSEDVSLELVGLKDEDTRIIRDEVMRLGVEKQLEITGRVDPAEIPKYLKNADVLLNPKVRGHAGSISSKLYEYMAARRPVVASVIPADREILNEKNACIVEPRPESFANAVMQLKEDKELRESLATQARRDAEHYTFEKKKELFEDFLKKI